MREIDKSNPTKEKESFKKARKIRPIFNLRYRLILTVTLEIIFSILLAIAVDTLCKWFFCRPLERSALGGPYNYCFVRRHFCNKCAHSLVY